MYESDSEGYNTEDEYTGTTSTTSPSSGENIAATSTAYYIDPDFQQVAGFYHFRKNKGLGRGIGLGQGLGAGPSLGVGRGIGYGQGLGVGRALGIGQGKVNSSFNPSVKYYQAYFRKKGRQSAYLYKKYDVTDTQFDQEAQSSYNFWYTTYTEDPFYTETPQDFNYMDTELYDKYATARGWFEPAGSGGNDWEEGVDSETDDFFDSLGDDFDTLTLQIDNVFEDATIDADELITDTAYLSKKVLSTSYNYVYNSTDDHKGDGNAEAKDPYQDGDSDTDDD